jgi:hypothetical protein
LLAANSSAYQPIVIPPEKTNDFLSPDDTSLYIGGIWGSVKRGSTWLATDCPRFILYATFLDVIYYQNRQFHYQRAVGFIGEVTTYAFVDAGRKAAPFVTIIEAEMKLILGVIAGSSGVGFALVVGTEVVQWTVEHSKDFPAWSRAVRRVLEIRQILKTHTPVLYDKLFDAVLKKFWGDVCNSFGEATTTGVISFTVGVIIGPAGAKSKQGSTDAVASTLCSPKSDRDKIPGLRLAGHCVTNRKGIRRFSEQHYYEIEREWY